MKYDAILFDLDGTLLDSSYDLVQTLNDILARYGQKSMPLSVLRPFISYGSTRLLEMGFDGNYPKDFQALRAEFLTHYQTQCTANPRLFDGIDKLLNHIENSQSTWGIITNKPTEPTQAIIEAIGFDSRAAAIVCGDTLPVAKPDPSPIILACEMIGVAPARCVYIGDCIRDIQAGQLAGMDTIACEYGYIGADDAITTWGADVIVKHPDELLAAISL